MTRLLLTVVALCAFVVVAVLGTYEPFPLAAGVGFLALFAALHPVVGYLVGRWWAVLLALLPAVLALPLGREGGETPIWVISLAIGFPAGAALIAVGVGLRRRRDRPGPSGTRRPAAG